MFDIPDPKDDDIASLFGMVGKHHEQLSKIMGFQATIDAKLRDKTKTDKEKFEKIKDKKRSASALAKREKPPFFTTPPSDPNEVKVWNQHDWYYCAKCNNGSGQWSTTHSTNGIEGKCSKHGKFAKPNGKSVKFEKDSKPPAKKQKTDDGARRRPFSGDIRRAASHKAAPLPA